MKKRNIKLTSFLVFCVALLMAFTPQKNKYNRLIWSKNQKIQWKDFTAKAPKSSKAHALTATEISFSLEYDKRKKAYEAEVKCVFIKDKSWVKENPTAELLKHERLHFDIAEIASRKIRMAVKKERVLESKNPSEKMNRIYKREMQSYEKMQKAYDRESDHSLDQEKQNLWNSKVAKELKKLQKYATN